MPEGPEVRKYADALDAALTGRAIVSLEARTKDARKWLHEHEQRLRGRRVERHRRQKWSCNPALRAHIQRR